MALIGHLQVAQQMGAAWRQYRDARVSQNVDYPLSLYGASKKANELMAHTYAHLFALPVTGLRFFTVYGHAGRPDMAMWLFADAILQGGR
jgi:UDP-glucuronate 4-epimerase